MSKNTDRDGVKFTYVRDFGEEGRVLTIARKWTGDENNISYAMAICNPKDKFQKERGRLIATGRLQCDRDGRLGPQIATVPQGKHPEDVVLMAIMEGLSPRPAQALAEHMYDRAVQRAL